MSTAFCLQNEERCCGHVDVPVGDLLELGLVPEHQLGSTTTTETGSAQAKGSDVLDCFELFACHV